jgi:uncharacterized protein (DUF2147 family)
MCRYDSWCLRDFVVETMQSIPDCVSIREMKWDGEEWDSGTIVDPENGKTYNCALWLEEGNVKPGRPASFMASLFL